MREYRYTQEILAKAIGINESTLHAKLNNKSYFKQDEIVKICKLLSIDTYEIGAYFYAR
jgi:DNA-binding XRE family transcriptional regulator